MKRRAILIAAAVLVLAAVAVYLRRKSAADAVAPVQLGTADGGSHDLGAEEPGVSGLIIAAGGVQRAFEAGA